MLVHDVNLKKFAMLVNERPNLSPTSQTCHQHISSQTSVTNIGVAQYYFETLTYSELGHLEKGKVRLKLVTRLNRLWSRSVRFIKIISVISSVYFFY